MVEDVTEELRLQAELAGSRRLEAIGQLAGGVAHDINNALTVILAYAARGQRTATGSERTAFTEIVAAGERAAEVAHELLAFARREPVHPRTLDAGVIVQALEPMLAKLVGATITVSIDVARDRWLVRADASQLERVMLNLAANARDAMPDGGTLTIRVSNRSVAEGGVRISAGDYVVIEVRDTGQGMTDDVLARVFEPFFTTKAERGGTGLGLASAYGAMKQLGGGISISSTPGAGTQVLLFCPRSEGAIEPLAARDPEAIAPVKRRILFVEDLEPLRQAIAHALEDAGYTVVSASDGDEALRIAAQDTGTFDALITDVVLPRKSGYRLARALRESRPDLRVLYLSGYDRPQGLDEALAVPGTAFLAKPFAPEAMIADLERLLDASR
jgi:CheY-like chemotaxis protein